MWFISAVPVAHFLISDRSEISSGLGVGAELTLFFRSKKMLEICRALHQLGEQWKQGQAPELHAVSLSGLKWASTPKWQPWQGGRGLDSLHAMFPVTNSASPSQTRCLYSGILNFSLSVIFDTYSMQVFISVLWASKFVFSLKWFCHLWLSFCIPA